MFHDLAQIMCDLIKTIADSKDEEQRQAWLAFVRASSEGRAQMLVDAERYSKRESGIQLDGG